MASYYDNTPSGAVIRAFGRDPRYSPGMNGYSTDLTGKEAPDIGMLTNQNMDNAFSAWWNKGAQAQMEAQYDRLWNQYVQEQNWAREDMANQLRMYREDTAHQREVADMRAAGLNPASRNGQGAGSDVGFTPAQPVTPASSGPGGENPFGLLLQVAQTASTVANVAKSIKEIGKVGAEIKNINADTTYKDKLSNYQQLSNEFMNEVYDDKALEQHYKTKGAKLSNEQLEQSIIYQKVLNGMAEFDKEHQLDRYTFEMMFNDVEYKYQKILNEIGDREITQKDLQNAFSSRELEFLKITGLYQNMPPGMADIVMRSIGNGVKSYNALVESGKTNLSFWEWYDSSISANSVRYGDTRYRDSATDNFAQFFNTALNNLIPSFNFGFNNNTSRGVFKSFNYNYSMQEEQRGRRR